MTFLIPLQAAERLRLRKCDILLKWEASVREEVTAARHQSRPILLNSLPSFLDHIQDSLREGRPLEESDAIAIAKEHGDQRAQLPSYSLEQFIQEFHLLHRAVLEELEAEARLDRDAASLLRHAIDHAVQKATDRYARATRWVIQASEERFRLLLDGAKDYSIIELDRDGQIATWSEAAQAIRGYTEEEILGRHFSCFFSPEDEAQGKPAHALERAAAEGRYEEEGWRVRKDGSRFWADMVVTALHDEDGHLRGFCHVTRDVSERKTLEDALLERTAELERVDERKNNFLAVLAHELRTPLSVLTNSIYVLKQAILGENEQRMLEASENQIHLVSRLIEDLMDVTRIARGKIDLRKEKVSLSKIAHRTAEGLHALFEKRNQEFLCHLSSDALIAEADSARMGQVITNLLRNAAKYTEAGGTIRLTTRKEGDEAVLSVCDTGIGIHPDLLPHVFDLYTQADSPEVKSKMGLGIGLNLAQSLVKLHGGRIEAQSDGEGKGSEFIVRIPLSSPLNSPAAPDSSAMETVSN